MPREKHLFVTFRSRFLSAACASPTVADLTSTKEKTLFGKWVNQHRYVLSLHATGLQEYNETPTAPFPIASRISLRRVLMYCSVVSSSKKASPKNNFQRTTNKLRFELPRAHLFQASRRPSRLSDILAFRYGMYKKPAVM